MDHVELNHVEYFQGIMEIAEIEIEVKRQNSIRIIVSHRPMVGRTGFCFNDLFYITLTT